MLETVEKRLTEKKGAKKTMTSPAAIFFAKNFVCLSRGAQSFLSPKSLFFLQSLFNKETKKTFLFKL
jgi:hypothetical protein